MYTLSLEEVATNNPGKLLVMHWIIGDGWRLEIDAGWRGEGEYKPIKIHLKYTWNNLIIR